MNRRKQPERTDSLLFATALYGMLWVIAVSWVLL
jgi:hypothetical protein